MPALTVHVVCARLSIYLSACFPFGFKGGCGAPVRCLSFTLHICTLKTRPALDSYDIFCTKSIVEEAINHIYKQCLLKAKASFTEWNTESSTWTRPRGFD